MASRLPVPLLGLLVFALSLGAGYWYLGRAAPAPAVVAPAERLDVYCSGRVDAAGQVVALEPAAPGRVAAVRVAEGDAVLRDQVLLELDSAVADYRVAQAESALALAEIAVAQAGRALERFPNQLAARAAAAKAARFRVEAAEQSLAQRKVAAQSAAPLGAAELAGLEAQIGALAELETAERAGLADVQSMRPDLAAQVAAAEAKRAAATAELASARRAKADCTLRAPAAGVVLRLQATAGGLVSPGSPVPPLVFAPAGPYVVRAEVDQEAAPGVVEGAAVEVRDENRPDGPLWRGTVKSLAGWVAQRRTPVLEPGEINDVRTVECVVALAPGGARLWIGQRMRVRILTAPPGAPPDPIGAGR